MNEQQQKAIDRIRARDCSIRGVVELSEVALQIHNYRAVHEASYKTLMPVGTIQVGFESASTGRDREAYIAPDGTRVMTENTYRY